MRFPHLYFIKYLILSGKKVDEELKKVELPKVTKGEIQVITEEMQLPSDFKMDDKLHKSSVDYMKAQGVYNLFFQDKATEEAFGFLKTLELRAALQKLIIAREEPRKIARTLNSKFDTRIVGDSIERFRHYFWNPALMKMEDWVELYSDLEKREIKNIYLNGPDYARHCLGFIQSIQIKESLKELASTLHFDMQAIKHQQESESKVRALTGIANTLIKIDEKLNTNDVSIKKEFENFERIRIEHTQANIKGIFDVAKGGNFSGSGAELSDFAPRGKILDIDIIDQ